MDVGKADLAGGFWTPATAMGQPLLARLQAHAGIRFEVLAR
jgi:saccharopine dehydrogenase (NAD+, L-glutamate forming)